MKNKVLIRVYVPSIVEEYEVFIPVNDSIKSIIQLIVKSINELNQNVLVREDYCFLDPITSSIYELNLFVRDTNIINSKKVILI